MSHPASAGWGRLAYSEGTSQPGVSGTEGFLGAKLSSARTGTVPGRQGRLVELGQSLSIFQCLWENLDLSLHLGPKGSVSFLLGRSLLLRFCESAHWASLTAGSEGNLFLIKPGLIVLLWPCSRAPFPSSTVGQSQ